MAGTARPRSVSVTPIGDFDLIDAPDGVQPGDILLAWVTSTGDVDDIDISGGAPWVALAEDTSVFSTRMYAQVAGPTNPSTYAIELGDDARGLVSVAHLRGATLSSLVIAVDAGDVAPGTGIPCPDASPGVAGGTEVRYAAAQHFVDIEFVPLGYREEDQGGDLSL
ncbi:hypothetical protein ITP53_11240, partial [Nonomuraea sp. K274]